jgi:hypothetical protein
VILEILRVNIIIGYVRQLLWLLFTLEDPASSPSLMKNERCSNSTAVLKSRRSPRPFYMEENRIYDNP